MHLLANDFIPMFSKCMDMSDVSTDIKGQIDELNPEFQFDKKELPYLMATYKLHKQQYRWLTNVDNCIFGGQLV